MCTKSKASSNKKPSSATARKNQLCKDEMKPSDILSFNRGNYRHFGIVDGNGEIIHLNKGENERWPTVKKDSFETVAEDSEATISNDYDNQFKPLSSKEILQRAEKCIGDRYYNVFTYNCEHFVNLCRYGIRRSRQVRNYFAIGGIYDALYWLFDSRPWTQRN